MKELGSRSHYEEFVPNYVDAHTQHGACIPTQAACVTTEPSIGTAPPPTEPLSDTAAIDSFWRKNTPLTVDDAPNVSSAQDLGIEGI